MIVRNPLGAVSLVSRASSSPDGDHDTEVNKPSLFGRVAMTDDVPVPSAFMTTSSQTAGESRTTTKRLPSGENETRYETAFRNLARGASERRHRHERIAERPGRRMLGEVQEVVVGRELKIGNGVRRRTDDLHDAAGRHLTKPDGALGSFRLDVREQLPVRADGRTGHLSQPVDLLDRHAGEVADVRRARWRRRRATAGDRPATRRRRRR